MNRETTNRIRFVIEELLPPIVRDSQSVPQRRQTCLGRAHRHGSRPFAKRAPFLTAEEYEALYREHPRVHEGTDNSEACISGSLPTTSSATPLCDVGCGTGVLLTPFKKASRPLGKRLRASISS